MQMIGRNQYYVDSIHGKQDATKQIKFVQLPAVLQVDMLNIRSRLVVFSSPHMYLFLNN